MMSLAILGARRTEQKETGQDVKLVAHPYNTIDEKMARETCTAHTCVGLEADGVVRHSQPCQVSRWMAEALLPALGRVAGARPTTNVIFAHGSPPSLQQAISACNNTNTLTSFALLTPLDQDIPRLCRPRHII